MLPQKTYDEAVAIIIAGSHLDPAKKVDALNKARQLIEAIFQDAKTPEDFAIRALIVEQAYTAIRQMLKAAAEGRKPKTINDPVVFQGYAQPPAPKSSAPKVKVGGMAAKMAAILAKQGVSSIDELASKIKKGKEE